MYRLHCFAQSGNCFKVAFLLRVLEQPFETVFVDYLAGTTREPNWREQENEMGEIPVLEDGGRRLTQSGAILTYLAAKHRAYGGSTEDEKLEVLRWLLFDNHKFTSYFGTYRFLKSFGPSRAGSCRDDLASGARRDRLRHRRQAFARAALFGRPQPDDRRLLAVGLRFLSR